VPESTWPRQVGRHACECRRERSRDSGSACGNAACRRPDGRRGDLIVEVRLMLPKLLDERSKELLREFGRINGESVRDTLYPAASHGNGETRRLNTQSGGRS